MITHIARVALAATALALSSSAATAQSVTRYSYDPLGRLSAVSSNTGETSTYSYDLAGNRTQVVRVGDTIPNPNFQNGQAGWQMATSYAGPVNWGDNLNADWSGSGNDVLFSTMGGTPPVGALVDVRTDWMAAQAGVTYQTAVPAAQHRGQAEVWVEFYDANKSTINAFKMAGAAREGGAYHGDLANFDAISGYALAPPGAAFRRINLRLAATGGNDPYGFFTRPTSRSVSSSVQNIFNPRFLSGQSGWQMATSHTGAVNWGDNLNADWSGSGNDVLYSTMAGTPAVGALLDIRSDWMASSAGVAYETSVQAAQHRGTIEVWVEFYDAGKNTISTAKMAGAAREGGGSHGDLANFNQIGGFATAPAGTAWRRVNLRLAANGGGDPYAFFTRPISRVAAPGQQTLTSWAALYP